MDSKDRHGQSVIGLSGVWVSIAHTIFASAAFFCALVVGMSLHFNKIVQNEFYGYPQEWFPSVSAAIGDRYPERSVFQILIAVTSGPRFALVLLWYFISSRSGTIGPKIIAIVGLLRTFSCGGWVYVTSTDDHDFHDIVMIAYVVLTLPWTVGVIKYTPYNKQGNRYRKIFAFLFFGTLPVLIRYFIKHKIHRVPGAYTTYAFLEWSLIIYDIAFDAASIFDFKDVKFQVVNDKETLQRVPSRPKSSNMVAFNSLYFLFDVFTWFLFWSVITSVALTIWHFSLWGMGITGYESALFATSSPVLLAIPQLRKLLARFPQLSLLGLLIGVLSYKADTPESKLIGVAIGVAFSMFHLALQFWNSTSRPQLTFYKSTAFSLGLLASMVAKYSFFANNPIWPIINEDIGGWNQSALIAGFFVALMARREQNVQNEPLSSAGKKGSVFLAGIGLGALLFSLHTMASDAGTIISWGWDGYHMSGPQPIPYGAVTIFAAALGIVVGLYCNKSSTWVLRYILGAVGTFALVQLKGWYSFAGGLVLVVYLNTVVPILLASSSLYPPAKVFGIAGIMYSLLVLAQVWTVAYAFVPGGVALRERLDLVVGFTYVCIGLGVFQASRTRNLVAPSQKKTGNTPNSVRKVLRYAAVTLTALLAATVAATYVRVPKEPFQPYHPEDKVVTAGIWTVHFGLDNDMWASETRLEDVLRDLEVDIIGLLETDTQRSIGGHRDITQRLAYDLDMYVDYGPGPNKHTWGAALLSRFPIINSTHHLLPSPVGELAPAIHATLDVYGTPLDVVVFHSGQEEDELDRKLQTEYLTELMADSTNPLILLSYLVVTPLEGNYNTYVSDHSRMKDIDPTDWDRWCEYILYRDIHRVGYARVSRSTITDTEIQVGKFVLDGKSSTDTIIPESKVPESWRFPEIFRGEGVRGHFYHVFDEPRYYQ